MGLQINTNVAAMNAYRNLASTQGAMSTSLERLSSGLRINRAADDAAGLAISEKLRGQIQKEVDQLSQELGRIAKTTQFNGKGLLDGSFNGTFQIGANQGQSLAV